MAWVSGPETQLRFGERRLVLRTGHTDPPMQLGAKLQEDGWTVGLVNASFREDSELTPDCRAYLEELRGRRGPLNAYVVIGAHLEEALRQTGLGARLYVAAAQEAASLGGALVRHDCAPEGRTSEEALRLWEGTTLREQLDVEGERVASLKRRLL